MSLFILNYVYFGYWYCIEYVTLLIGGICIGILLYSNVLLMYIKSWTKYTLLPITVIMYFVFFQYITSSTSEKYSISLLLGFGL